MISDLHEVYENEVVKLLDVAISRLSRASTAEVIANIVHRIAAEEKSRADGAMMIDKVAKLTGIGKRDLNSDLTAARKKVQIIPPNAVAKKEPSLPQIEMILSQLSAENSTQVRNVGYALHHGFRASEEALSVFIAYAAKGGGMTEEQCTTLWEKAALNHPKPITLASILQMAKEEGISIYPTGDAARKFAMTTVHGKNIASSLS